MPKGPKGERRPADTVKNAMLIGRIATGDIQESVNKTPNRAKGGKLGAAARVKAMSAEERSAQARKASESRWNKK
ncbi:hypothetical protein BH10PSE11_BH10PSE11_36160 [soil metagenome]